MFNKLGSAFTIQHTMGLKKPSEGRMRPAGLSLATSAIEEEPISHLWIKSLDSCFHILNLFLSEHMHLKLRGKYFVQVWEHLKNQTLREAQTLKDSFFPIHFTVQSI